MRSNGFEPAASQLPPHGVQSRLLRFYYLSNDRKESNKAFIDAGTFAGPRAAAALDLPVEYGVEALERTTLLVCDLLDFGTLVDRHPVGSGGSSPRRF